MYTKKSMLGASALTAAAAMLAPMQVHAIEYYLRAGETSVTVPNPDGGPDLSVPMWGYALCTGVGSGCGAFTVPGPALNVPAGDATLTVHLLNGLTHPTSLVINGLIKSMTPVWDDGTSGARPSLTARVRSFDVEAAPNNGAQADYTWSNVSPGTYLYHSGTQPQVQVQMGLYGAATKNAVEATMTAPAQVYAGAAYAYDNQATLFYSEVDPALHAAVADGSYGTTGPTSTLNYEPKYFLINGKPYQIGAPGITPVAASGSTPSTTPTTLLRVLNAGLTTHVPMIQGAYWDVIAEDGKPHPFKSRQYTAMLPAAKTLDLLLSPGSGYTSSSTYAILDRRLSLSNNGVSNGGMLAVLGNGGALAGGGVGGGGSGGGTNSPPIAVADTYASVPGVMLRAGAPGVLVNDDMTDGPLLGAVAVVNGPTACGGTYTLSGNGALTYKPPVVSPSPLPGGCSLTGAGSYSMVGSDSFSYRATDGGVMSNVADVTISAVMPVAPALPTLDNFDRANAISLGANWIQQVATTSPNPDIGILGSAAIANTTAVSNGLAIFDSTLGEKQAATFTLGASPLNAALVLKASGGTAVAPANYVRVRYESNGGNTEVVVATMTGGSNAPTFVRQAGFAATVLAGEVLSATVDAKGLVTTFLGGSYLGGVQLPDVAAWKGTGKVGIQLQTPGATVENFGGGTLP